jgi:hypothetical protein
MKKIWLRRNLHTKCWEVKFPQEPPSGLGCWIPTPFTELASINMVLEGLHEVNPGYHMELLPEVV